MDLVFLWKWLLKWSLTLATFIPLFGAGIILLIPKSRLNLIRWLTLVISGIPLIIGIINCFAYNPHLKGFQFVTRVPWINSIGVHYFMGIDGISLPLYALTLLLCFVSFICSWRIDRLKGFFSLMLLLEVGMVGVFCALDFVLFYVFWELVLIPMYFIIGIWGGQRREYAAIKFFIYTLFGSVLMLVGILALYFKAVPHTFDIVALSQFSYPLLFQKIVFVAFFIAFAIKVPMFPFHTWLPDAHVEAPTAGSVLLAGILLKMGAYGFIRISLPVLPEATRGLAKWVALLAIISIIYGSLCAMAQTDLKKLVAYSSIGHMGYVMLGIAALNVYGINGAIFGMVAHGLITGMLFIMVGAIYERSHTRMMNELGGLTHKIPILAGILAFSAIASLGLPGLSGFWGEVLAIIGAFKPYLPYAVLAALGAVITAGYFLWMLQRVNMGEVPEKIHEMADITGREASFMVPMCALIVLFGIFPSLMINLYNNTVMNLLKSMGI